MLRYIFTLLFITVMYFPSHGQQTVAHTPDSISANHGHLRISLITCGMGNEIWQTFGHTAIRIIDSTKNDDSRDVVYNYGLRDEFDGSFFWTFVSGKLSVFLGTLTYTDFIKEYVEAGRGIEEQIFLLNDDQELKMRAFLDNNALIENRGYTYQIFFDNCCTRARDALPQVLGSGFVLGDAIPKDLHLSYRTAFNLYYRNRYWERVGINICMGSTTDTIIANRMITFLPEFLSIALSRSTLDGKKVSADKTVLLPDHINHNSGINQPFIVSCIICLLTLMGLSAKRFQKLGKIMTLFVLLLSGCLSICVLFHWFYSDHVYGKDNFNILWALPTNLFVGFLHGRYKRWYGLTGMCFIIICLLLHVLDLQIMPIFEIGPYLLALLCVYGMMYRKSFISHIQANKND